MYEINCTDCKRVIGFKNKKLYGKAKNQTVIQCIDCYFKYITKIVQENKTK